MKFVKFISFTVVVIIAAVLFLFFIFYDNLEGNYQKNADRVRIEHLVYWTGLIEEYHDISGMYPFQDRYIGSESIGLVRIVSEYQSQYFDPDSPSYRSEFDNNWNNRFRENSVQEMLLELERVLGREIEARFDFQKVPTNSPIGYNYFVTNDGYLMWVTCKSCGVTLISTLLMDGITPSVNIGSEGMVPKVTKAFTREDMLSNPTFQLWLSGKWQ